ncbi:hypothetical protein JXO59_11525 [candidate division KSB1 bacterium]|nr:hypothetical protein [candidate division KSB1 bacterium]
MQPWPEFTSWPHLVNWHIQLHPGFAVQDLYKLMYQGVLGAEHLLTDFEGARAGLQAEWLSLAKAMDDPIVEPVSIDHSIVRLNLRPCKILEWSLEKIWQIFYLSATTQSAKHADFVTMWQSFIPYALSDLNMATIKSFDHEMGIKQYPPCHHSQTYHLENKPAYRVVSGRIIYDAIQEMER